MKKGNLEAAIHELFINSHNLLGTMHFYFYIYSYTLHINKNRIKNRMIPSDIINWKHTD
jgi:hypothetical protein